MNDLPCIVITALSAGHLLKEVKLHPADVAIPVQINAMEHLLQGLDATLRQSQLPSLSLPLLYQRGSFERDRVVFLPRLEMTAGGEWDEGIGTSVQV